VTIINDYSATVTAKINGTVHRVSAHTRVGPFGVTPGTSGNGNDVYEITTTSAGCGGMGGANGSLQDHGAHTLHIATDTRAMCGTPPGQYQFTAWIDPGHHGI
jgi:hypothetical protein